MKSRSKSKDRDQKRGKSTSSESAKSNSSTSSLKSPSSHPGKAAKEGEKKEGEKDEVDVATKDTAAGEGEEKKDEDKKEDDKEESEYEIEKFAMPKKFHINVKPGMSVRKAPAFDAEKTGTNLCEGETIRTWACLEKKHMTFYQLGDGNWIFDRHPTSGDYLISEVTERTTPPSASPNSPPKQTGSRREAQCA